MSTSLCSSRDKANAKSVSFPPLFWQHTCTFLHVQYVHTIQESTNTCIGSAKSLWHAPPELEPLWTQQWGHGMSQPMIPCRSLCTNGVYPSWLYGVMVISSNQFTTILTLFPPQSHRTSYILCYHIHSPTKHWWTLELLQPHHKRSRTLSLLCPSDPATKLEANRCRYVVSDGLGWRGDFLNMGAKSGSVHCLFYFDLGLEWKLFLMCSIMNH